MKKLFLISVVSVFTIFFSLKFFLPVKPSEKCQCKYFLPNDTRADYFVKRVSEDEKDMLDSVRPDAISSLDTFEPIQEEADLPMIYVITPTFNKSTLIPELLAVGNALSNVKRVTWLVVEDSVTLNERVSRLLKRFPFKSVHLLGPMDSSVKTKRYSQLPRGASNRNAGLKWIRDNVHDDSGVVYFADDDNTYDMLIFEEIRYTKKISLFPVGLTTQYMLTTPLVRNGRIMGFYDGWVYNRKYPMDMAEFAVSVPFLRSRPNAQFVAASGVQETKFMTSLEPFELCDLEPLAANCTQILVFHTKSDAMTKLRLS